MTGTHLLIESPSRSARAGSVIIIATVVLLSIASLSFPVRPWIVLVAAVLIVGALLVRDIHALDLAALALLLTVVPLLYHPCAKWPFSLLVPIILYLGVSVPVAPLRRSLLDWLRPGRLARDTILLIIATALISGAALYLWHRWTRPDLSIQLAYMPDMPFWLFPFAGLAFSIGNAAMEEFVFRGVIMQALDGALGPFNAPIFIQGWLFGAAHYFRGFPRGDWGLVMAALYGIMLGIIRRRSQGMLAPWIAHMCADLVIFIILAAVVLGK